MFSGDGDPAYQGACQWEHGFTFYLKVEPSYSSSFSKPITWSTQSSVEIPICERMYSKPPCDNTHPIHGCIFWLSIQTFYLSNQLLFLCFWLEWTNPRGLVNNGCAGVTISPDSFLQTLDLACLKQPDRFLLFTQQTSIMWPS